MRYRGYQQSPFPLRRKRQAGQNILMKELVEVFQQLGFSATACQSAEHIDDGQSRTAHAGLAETCGGVDGDALEQIHGVTINDAQRLMPTAAAMQWPCLGLGLSHPSVTEAS
jgi:hypothetical protein